VILVSILAIVREDEIGGSLAFQLFEDVFDRGALVRKKPVAKVRRLDVEPSSTARKQRSASAGFQLAPTWS
jgi:hypothetical protein